MRKIIPLLFAVTSLPLAAQEEVQDAPPPPPMPESAPPAEPATEDAPEAGENVPVDPELGPRVTIIEKEEQVIEEYRAGGQLYMVKITPRNGAPYYLIDNDGDGRLETRRTGLEDPVVPQWVIFRW